MTISSVVAGTALKNGAAAGSGMFLMSGGTTSFDIAGSYTIGDALGDDSISTLPAAQSYTPGNGAGAAITKLGNGVLTFSGTNTYAGATVVNAGSLRVAVTGKINASAVTLAAPGILTGDGSTIAIDSFGTLAPGTPTDPQGTLLVNGSMRLESGALTCFHANGASTGVSDLNVTGLATLNGMARIDFNGGPTVGTSYVLMNAGSISGSFAGFETNIPTLDGNFSYTSTTVTFTVSASDVLFENSFEQSVSASPCSAAFTN
jgi:autotransporter-associated beta strand protein